MGLDCKRKEYIVLEVLREENLDYRLRIETSYDFSYVSLVTDSYILSEKLQKARVSCNWMIEINQCYTMLVLWHWRNFD